MKPGTPVAFLLDGAIHFGVVAEKRTIETTTDNRTTFIVNRELPDGGTTPTEIHAEEELCSIDYGTHGILALADNSKLCDAARAPKGAPVTVPPADPEPDIQF